MVCGTLRQWRDKSDYPACLRKDTVLQPTQLLPWAPCLAPSSWGSEEAGLCSRVEWGPELDLGASWSLPLCGSQMELLREG